MQLQPGQIVGEYRILEPLGAGGTGRVYKVEHLVTKRLEAMKLLLAGEAATAEQVQRFEREIRLQATLRHPNIAPVYNAFFHEKCLFLVMELLEGESLEKLLERGTLPQARALYITEQVLRALDHAHSRGVLHRDISTANIMIGAEDEVKLTDFGLAIHREDARVTASGTPVGSYYYMSPEQVRGREALDPRTDLYSCGAVLYELATGRRPFEHGDAYSLMEAHAHHEPVAPRALQPGLSVELEAVIQKAMAKDRNQRYSGASEFLTALKAALAAAPSVPPPPVANRPWVAFAASSAVVLVTVVIAVWLARPAAEEEPVRRFHAGPDPEPAAVVSEAPPPMPALPVTDSVLPEPLPRARAGNQVRAAVKPAVAPPAPIPAARVLNAVREPATPVPPTEDLPKTMPVPIVKRELPQQPPAQPAPLTAEKSPAPEPVVRRPGRWGRLRALNPARIFLRGGQEQPASKEGKAPAEASQAPLRQP